MKRLSVESTLGTNCSERKFRHDVFLLEKGILRSFSTNYSTAIQYESATAAWITWTNLYANTTTACWHKMPKETTQQTMKHKGATADEVSWFQGLLHNNLWYRKPSRIPELNYLQICRAIFYIWWNVHNSQSSISFRVGYCLHTFWLTYNRKEEALVMYIFTCT